MLMSMRVFMAANWRNVGLAFLDGFAPLDNLFARPVRPGSEDDLIGAPAARSEYLRPGVKETEAYVTMRKRLTVTIADLDSRFFATPDDAVRDARR
jgi:hypothetical protein